MSDNGIDMEVTKNIYLAAINKMRIVNTLKTSVASVLLSCIGELKAFCPTIQSSIDDDYTSNKDSIQQQLCQYGLCLKSSQDGGVGNCFFYSLANGLLEDLPMWHTILVQKGLVERSLLNLSQELRSLFVKELCGEKREHYRCFTTLQQDEYQEETSKFLVSGYFDSSIGNLMPLAMSNALFVNFVILRPSQQPLYITPENAVNNGTVFLVYYEGGKGHYDGVNPVTTDGVTGFDAAKKLKCNCGVNSKGSPATSCAPQSVTMYKSRCLCLKNNQACSSACRCNGCKNPFGEKEKPLEKKTRKRRHPHDLQMCLPSSKRFGEDKGEEIKRGAWSSLNLLFPKKFSEFFDTKSCYDAIKVMNTYNHVHYYSNASFCTVEPSPHIVIFECKSLSQVTTAKIMYIFRDKH